LGAELRFAAEQIAWASGQLLSDWVKRLVEQAVAQVVFEDRASRTNSSGIEAANATEQSEGDVVQKELDAAFSAEMERLR
jgi:hypothetical protein